MNRFRNFAPQAADDLDEAVSRLLDSGWAPSAAERLLKAVLDAGERLALRPFLERRRAELLGEPFRFWSLPRFELLLVYNPTTSPPTILRVLHTAQDLALLLADLEDSSEDNTPPDPQA